MHTAAYGSTARALLGEHCIQKAITPPNGAANHLPSVLHAGKTSLGYFT